MDKLPAQRPKRSRGPLGALLGLVWILLFVSVPLAGVWIASSLAAYLNGPRWLAITAGVLVFPVLPAIWELEVARSRARRGVTKKRWMTLPGRLTVRTWVLSLVFLAALLVQWPTLAFTAISTRGDWMLDGRSGIWVATARGVLLEAAGGLGWLYKAALKDPYAQQIDPARLHPAPPPPPPRQMPEIHTYGADASAPDPDGGLESTEDGGAPAELPDDEEIVGYYILDGRTVYQRQKRSDAGVEPDAAARHDGAPDAGEEPEAPRVTPQLDRWPMREELHPAIKDIPASAETSIASVADYVVRAERDPLQRVKALHDYVADRVVYDVEALRSGNFPPQTPEEVFRSHKAVCAGYAQLLSALGQAAGLEIPVVVGVAKTEKEPESHAWNAAKVGDRWFLIDATWDAGSVGEHGFEKRYRTEHLFAPPAIFVLAHLPRDAGWQLLPNAVALSEFVRQPALDPLFFIHGLAFTTPVRRQMDTARWATLELDNPKEIPLLAKLAGEGSPGSCEVLPLPARRSRIRCEMPSPAVYRMTLFVATGTEGLTTHYTSAASVTFNNSI